MGVTFARLRVVCIACVGALAACSPQNNTKQCSANGEIYFCPEGTECGGVQMLCVSPGGCGNGVVETGEECDDGNILPGDGCSPQCRNEVCGNHIPDPGEVCDDGNIVSGDGCSSDCKSDESCGNLKIDKDKKDAKGRGEVCDDGNNIDGDGCSADCRSTEICGNGIIDTAVGEVCDDGPGGSENCSPTCRSNLTCNNFNVDPGEECDHGLFGANNPKGNDNANDCRKDCVLNRCGDGFVDNQPGPHHEDCDGAPVATPNSTAAVPTETPACNIDCTFVRCGDGKVNKTAGEQCDDSNAVSGDGCSSDCKIERCGDGIVNNGEQCDRALTPATCNTDCTFSTCGDGKLNPQAVPPEQCDDGNRADGDGCSAGCTFEHCGNGVVDHGEECDDQAGLQPCSATCHQERCGNGILDQDPARSVNEQCDDGNTDDNDGCSHLCVREFCGDGKVNNGEACDRALTPAACNIDCTPSVCGDHKINTAAIPPEQCDDGGTTNGDGCSATCTFEHCGNGVVDNGEQCDGPLAGLQPCSATCHQEICGNGILDQNPEHGVNEQCDDGNISDNDGCSHLCVREFCGDAIVNNGEACDRALTPATCNIDCTFSTCGDGKLNPAAVPPEQCDDGGNVNGDGCSSTCVREFCGDGIVNNGEACDRGLTPATCNIDCTPSSCGDGKLNTQAVPAEQCDDGNSTAGDGCSTLCRLEHCGNGAVDNGEECDGLLGLQPCSPICRQERCGNGILEVDPNPANNIHEQCDDGNTTAGDGCSASCQLEHCGNGVVDPGEQCDGPLAGLQPCSASCRREICGNGILDRDPANLISEECDDGNTDDDDGCSAACVFEFCGDGLVNNHEVCDAARTPATCNLDCTASSCGDGVVNPFAIPPEQCDDHNAVGGDGCSATCQTERCGNGILDPGETCDGAIGPQPCSARCQAEVCGNGIVDLELDEQCDDSNTDDNDGCSHDCKLERCGDGILNNHETCDRVLTPATCNLDCTPSICGDGKLNTSAVPPEQCDDGNSTNGDGCSSVCRLEHCGNGVVDNGEECDGLQGLQPCSAICHQERCGNGIIEVDAVAVPAIHEQCDNGSTGPNNNDNTHSCTATCQVAVCGDGFTEAGVEQCDDGANNGNNKDCTTACRINVCGDGLRDSAVGPHFEACDNGQDNTDDPVCPYNTSCVRCSTTCTVLVTVVPTCGDGIVHGPQEVCDDHNTDACGSCSAGCAAITSQRAIGFIVAVSGAQLADGETLTLDDGVNPPVVFEFDDEGNVATDHVAVPFTGSDGAIAVRQSLIDAITSGHPTKPLLITATAEGSVVVSLTHDRPTTLGNQPITETVADPLFLVIGMQNGAGGDCATGVGCQTSDDCASHSCSPATHTCDPDPPSVQVLTSR